MGVAIDRHDLLLAGDATLPTRCRLYLVHVHVDVAIDGHQAEATLHYLHAAGDTLIPRARA